MASKITQLWDKFKTKKLYPVTLTKAVYDEDGNLLDDTLSELNSKLTEKANLNDYTELGYATYNSPASISVDLTDVKALYAVIYSSSDKTYCNPIVIPLGLLLIHPCVFSYSNKAEGSIVYDSTSKTLTITAYTSGYTVYAYKFN